MSRPGKERPFRGIWGWALKICLTGLLFMILLTVMEVAILRIVNPPVTVFSAWTWVQNKIASQSYEKPRRQWRSVKEISPHLVQAVLAGEDQRFLSHCGFDFIELNEALRDILSAGRVRGASTISMQVARTVFLWPGAG